MNQSEQQPWRVVGWDAFAGEEYPVSQHMTEGEAREAARRFLQDIEREQPSEASGGQSGIQDQVFIVSPNGVRHRFHYASDDGPSVPS